MGSNWFALGYSYTHDLSREPVPIITDGISAVDVLMDAAISPESKQLVYSQYRHDCHMTDDGAVGIDGCRNYFRLLGGGVLTKVQIEKDKLVLLKIEGENEDE